MTSFQSVANLGIEGKLYRLIVQSQSQIKHNGNPVDTLALQNWSLSETCLYFMGYRLVSVEFNLIKWRFIGRAKQCRLAEAVKMK